MLRHKKLRLASSLPRDSIGSDCQCCPRPESLKALKQPGSSVCVWETECVCICIHPSQLDVRSWLSSVYLLCSQWAAILSFILCHERGNNQAALETSQKYIYIYQEIYPIFPFLNVLFLSLQFGLVGKKSFEILMNSVNPQWATPCAVRQIQTTSCFKL